MWGNYSYIELVLPKFRNWCASADFIVNFISFVLSNGAVSVSGNDWSALSPHMLGEVMWHAKVWASDGPHMGVGGSSSQRVQLTEGPAHVTWVGGWREQACEYGEGAASL